MKKIVIVFDLDDTLFNDNNSEEIEWHASKEEWLDLCARLKNRALADGIELHFAIATSKAYVDAIVIEAAKALQEYLRAFDGQQQLPIVQNDYVHVSSSNIALLSHLHQNQNEDAQDRQSIASSIQVAIADNKNASLKKIADLFEVKDLSHLILIDDLFNNVHSAKLAGFSAVSAGNIWSPDKTTRDNNARELIAKIEDEVARKIFDLKNKNPASTFFFSAPPDLRPRQKDILGGFVGFDEDLKRSGPLF